MAPSSLVTASVSWLARSFSLLSSSGSLARCTSVLPASYINPGRSLTSQASGPPKKPLNGYLRYVMQQQPVFTRRNPEIKCVDIIRTIAQQWRTMGQEQKRPFEEASVRDRERFKVELERYQAQLSPEQLQQQALEKKERMAKRKAIRKKRELTNLGKPKRPRSSFNIFMSEHFVEARGTTTQVYTQLAEDDKIRYKNEMKSWEDHMMDIGREDLIREQTLSANRKAAKKTLGAKTGPKKTKAKVAAKKASATGKSKTTRKTAQSGVGKLVRTTKKT
ncbi:Transcription factor A, mitochondrial [Liparis tanakae]|uniref:Transcription factor A, mitochondrial n=1 Tax=Liparis tanakae TaxID=230148 RepID=A0A4Z2G1K2_9TELE|nr:Transcription factor A, mitochondrial [Liparis tanakae]